MSELSSPSVRIESLAQRPVRIRARSVRRALIIIGFLAPAALIFTTFVLYPITQTVGVSLFSWEGLGPLTKFVGIANFQRAFGDAIFRGALINTVVLIAATLLTQLPAALGLALLMRRQFRGRTALRLIYFLPFVLSEVVAAEIWNFIYQPQYGAANTILGAIVPGFHPITWLGQADIALFAIFTVSCWKYVGFHMILFLTGLQQIPAELEEAARIDGASDRQVIWHITLPLLAGTIRLTVFLAVLIGLQMFELIFVMTGGGPAHASETITTYLYNYGFKTFQLGYGSALALILFAICFAFALLYQRAALRRDFSGDLAARG